MGHFVFKHFTIDQSLAAMKIGTDGVLLGAWVDLPELSAPDFLDVGCGSGLVALQLAQRYQTARITGIDIDDKAIEASHSNFQGSPWSDRMQVVQSDFCQWATNKFECFDAIVSNPPFFEGWRGQSSRDKARSAHFLPLNELISQAFALLRSNGVLSLILPADRLSQAEQIGTRCGFALKRYCLVKGRADLPVKRVLIEWIKTSNSVVTEREELIIEIDRHVYTEEYRELTRDFYLNF